tara:strand:+ start:546 stop:818 length:273 start_codon:yes stop_codon:yes gene_type:complete
MKTLVVEILKTVLLCVAIFGGAVLWQTSGLFNKAATAKALRYKKINDQPNGVFSLTREERDEYMDYLRVLSGYTYDDESAATPIYTLELP